MINQDQIKAVQKLISKYRSITLGFVEGIRNLDSEYLQRKNPLAPCDILDMIEPLCESTKCKDCILYVPKTHCPQHSTYKNIRDAKSEKALIIAIRERADFLEGLLKTKLEEES